jgi:hypothetical protein
VFRVLRQVEEGYCVPVALPDRTGWQKVNKAPQQNSSLYKISKVSVHRSSFPWFEARSLRTRYRRRRLLPEISECRQPHTKADRKSKNVTAESSKTRTLVIGPDDFPAAVKSLGFSHAAMADIPRVEQGRR